MKSKLVKVTATSAFKLQMSDGLNRANLLQIRWRLKLGVLWFT